MKKFSKILTLLLALVVIVTAFTVITLATDEATELSTPYVRAVTGSWESKVDGEYVGEVGLIATESAGEIKEESIFSKISGFFGRIFGK